MDDGDLGRRADTKPRKMRGKREIDVVAVKSIESRLVERQRFDDASLGDEEHAVESLQMRRDSAVDSEDSHVEFLRARHGLRQPSVGVFGVDGANSSHLQGLDGMFFVAKRCVVESVPFDEATFDGFHGYDVDFSFAAHLAGFRVGTTAEIAVIHASGGKFGDAWQRYAERFASKYRTRVPTG